ncbi:HAD-IIB family hydrolase [Fundidesulfovibrio putealis]|uniref:HAD-IIB family hydrolase n=1 Tax=Fundidesulfovibrio putealis TaxID=270496 RepID=UPI0004826B1E|nr:HAD-IIB family hydrolase [Fundidesulfovibrio putealis]
MKPIEHMQADVRRGVRYLLTDIDDTLTSEGRLPASAYKALEDLRAAGLLVVPITGRPAGWCDHIARMWPVDGVVGENGAFYFRYDESARRMHRRYFKDAPQRQADAKRLKELERRILAEVPGVAVSADQAYREADLAIDFCEDVPALPMNAARRVKQIFEQAGAQAKISSIHVNGWFGEYDKLSMTRLFFREVFRQELDEIRESVVFAGDSPNDAPMFAFFPNSVGVANVMDFGAELEAAPVWVTRARGGEGFAELAAALLAR